MKDSQFYLLMSAIYLCGTDPHRSQVANILCGAFCVFFIIMALISPDSEQGK